MGMGGDDAQPPKCMGGDKRQDGKTERFLKIAFGIVLSGKIDPHGLCGVIPFGCGGAFKGADGVPGFLGKNGEAEEPLFLRLGARFPPAAVEPLVHPLTRAAASPGLRYGGGMWPIRNHTFRTGWVCHTERQARGFAGEGCFMRLHWAALRLLVEDARKKETSRKTGKAASGERPSESLGEGETLELGDLAPGDVQRLPGHVGGSVRNEERGGKAHIPGRADASGRDGGNGPPHGFLGRAAFGGGFAGVPLHVHIRKDLAAAKGVGPDAVSRILEGEALT